MSDRFTIKPGDLTVIPRPKPVSALNYLVQRAAAEKLMRAYTSYAVEIGCQVVEDSIETTEAQAVLLAVWWKDQTK